MSVGQQADNEAFGELFLANDAPLDLGEERVEEGAGLLHGGVEGCDGAHDVRSEVLWGKDTGKSPKFNLDGSSGPGIPPPVRAVVW